MPKAIVKSLSFTDEYKEEFKHYMKQPNKSKYICELIRKDLLGIDNREFIEKIIEEKLKNYSLSNNKEIENNEEILDFISNDFGFN